ncbi:MAG: hybrid sensor histidine kinase/response regulator [Leadbetterella sp.]
MINKESKFKTKHYINVFADGTTSNSLFGSPYQTFIPSIEINETKIKSSKNQEINLDYLNLVLFTHNLSGELIYLNQKGIKSLGESNHNVLNKNINDILKYNSDFDFQAYMEEIYSFGEAKGLINFINEFGGKTTWEYNCAKAKEQNSDFVQGYLVNITEQVRKEDDNKKSHFKALKKLESKNHFLANFTHEINTLMSSVQGYGQMLSETNPTKKQREYIDCLNLASDSLIKMSHTLLDLAKIESGEFKLCKESVNIEEFIQNVRKIMLPQTKAKNLQFILEIGENIPKDIFLDPNSLNQILLNLIRNAIKFTHSGYIKISLQINKLGIEGHRLEFLIEDSGIGISKEDKEVIFERFSQIDSYKINTQKGFGLGLNICSSLVELMGGTISVVSKIDVGSTFKVVIPVEVVSEKPRSTYENRQIQGNKILLIDDNLLNLKLGKKLFEDQGCEVSTADTKLSIVQCLRKTEFDLILLDWELKDTQAPEVIDFIKSTCGNLPKIALYTAHVFASKVLEVADQVDGFIRKPIQSNTLIDEVSSILNINIIDLEYIKNLSNNNKEFENEILESAVEVLENESKEIIKALQKNEVKTYAAIFHKLISTYSVLGIDTTEIQNFEKNNLNLAEAQVLAQKLYYTSIKAKNSIVSFLTYNPF